MRGRWLATAALIATACSAQPRGPCDPSPAPGELGSVCGFRNPEDVEAIASLGVLVVSQMRQSPDQTDGSLAFIELAERQPTPRRLWPAEGFAAGASAADPRPPFDPGCRRPPLEDFSPHGITAREDPDGSVWLAVVGHGAREAVEFFELSGSGATLRADWSGCIRLPPASVGNDVVFRADGAVLVSDFQPTLDGVAGAYYAVVAGLGGVTGGLLEKQPLAPWRKLADSEAANPNGLLQSPDGRQVFFAQTGSGEIGALGAGAARRDVTIGGYPDNLAWSSRGTILAVTHTQGLGLLPCIFGRRPCRTSWSLFELDPESLGVKPILQHDGSVIGAVSSVAEFDGRYYFGAIYGDRIGVWTPPAASPDPDLVASGFRPGYKAGASEPEWACARTRSSPQCPRHPRSR